MSAFRKKREEYNDHPVLWGVLFLISLLLIGFYYYKAKDRAFCNMVCEKFAYPVRAFCGKISDYLSFGSYKIPSVTEILYTIAAVIVVVYIIRTVILVISRKGHRAGTLLTRILKGVTVVAFFWIYFCFTWNIGYGASTFADKSGLEVKGVSVDELTESAEYFAYLSCEYADDVSRDENGVCNISLDDCFSLEGLYNDKLLEEFECLGGKQTYMPKKMYYSFIMDRIGFTGFYISFTGQSIINTDPPSCYTPSTIAHELAHQRGVVLESEANFVAIVACLYSGNTDYMYSGSLLGLTKLMNSLYAADYDAWLRIYERLPESIKADWEAHNEFWKQYEGKTADTASSIYDSYLKSNGDELGIKSYGACVDLIVAWINAHKS